MTEADRIRLEHILDQIDRIGRYTAGGRSGFDDNEMIQDAVMRRLSVWATLSKDLPELRRDIERALG